MRSKAKVRFALVVCLNVASVVQRLVAQACPSMEPAVYNKYRLHCVDNRSVPEKLLNKVGLLSGDVGRSFAMIVGVARYPHLAPGKRILEPADRDINLLFEYLKNQQFFDEIVILRDEAVTFDNLKYFLETYFPDRMRMSPHSRFIFAYSGHGMTDGNHGFLLTTSAQSLSDKQNSIDMDVLRAFSQHTIEAGYQSLFLINSCHSGAFNGRQREGAWDYILKRPGAHAITSSGVQDSSWGENDKGSYFYQKLIEGLNGSADTGVSGIITVADLGAYLQKQVGMATGGRQVPTLPRDIWTGVSDGGVFFFNRAKAVKIADLPVWNPSHVAAYGQESADVTARIKSAIRDAEHGIDLYDAKRYKEALPFLHQAAETVIPASWDLLESSIELDEIRGAQYTLGAIYDDGLGTTKDKAKAAYWFRKVAEEYPDPSGLKEIKATADSYSKAAEQGDEAAMNSLGLIYEYGLDGRKKDEVAAVGWYRKAAKGSYPDAYFNLARMYEKGGGGLPKNLAEAAHWYRAVAFITLCQGECGRTP